MLWTKSEQIQLACDPDFESKGENCNCWDRVEYKLPCACIIQANPGVLPLDIIDNRWRFERDESMYNNVNYSKYIIGD